MYDIYIDYISWSILSVDSWILIGIKIDKIDQLILQYLIFDPYQSA